MLEFRCPFCGVIVTDMTSDLWYTPCRVPYRGRRIVGEYAQPYDTGRGLTCCTACLPLAQRLTTPEQYAWRMLHESLGRLQVAILRSRGVMVPWTRFDEWPLP